MPLLLVSISFLAGRRVGRRECCADDVRRDTIVVRDTVRDTVPVDGWRTFVRVDTCYLVRVDSLMLRDTVRVEMPIEQVEYRTDRYRAVVEGWRPKLLSIECYDSRQIITDTRRVATRKGGASCSARRSVTASRPRGRNRMPVSALASV